MSKHRAHRTLLLSSIALLIWVVLAIVGMFEVVGHHKLDWLAWIIVMFSMIGIAWQLISILHIVTKKNA